MLHVNIIPDDDCDNNDTRLKESCMSNQMCIAQTYFDYPNGNRYTWYSCDKKVNEDVLTEKYVQQYLENASHNLILV